MKVNVMLIALLFSFSLHLNAADFSSSAADESSSFASSGLFSTASGFASDDLDLLGVGGDALGAKSLEAQVRAFIDEQYAGLDKHVREDLKEKVLADGSQIDFVALLGTRKAPEDDDAADASDASEDEQPDPQMLIAKALEGLLLEAKGSGQQAERALQMQRESLEHQINGWKKKVALAAVTTVIASIAAIGEAAVLGIIAGDSANATSGNCTA